MSDALTDINRDQTREKKVSDCLEKLCTYLEDPSKDNYETLKASAKSADSIPRGYYHGRTNLEEDLESLLSKLRNGDEIEWARFLSAFYSSIRDSDLYKRFENLSPFKGKIVIRVSYGNGFLLNTDELTDILIGNVLREMGHKTHEYQKYFVIMPKMDIEKIRVMELKEK